MNSLFRIIAFSIVFYSFTIAQIPHKLNYQGILTDNNGAPLSGNQALTLRLYNVGNGGTALWEESQNINVDNGVFNVILGDVTPLNLAFDEQYWLGITVAPNPTELTPRIQLTAAAYSLNAVTVSDPTISPWQKSGNILYYNQGPVYVGRTSAISGSGNEYFGVRATTGANQYGGMYMETSDANGWPYYGYATNNTWRVWHYFVPSDTSWRMYNNANRIVVKSDGRIGLNTTTPVSNFQLNQDQFTNPGGFGGLALLQTFTQNKWNIYVSQSSNDLRLFYNDAAMGAFSSINGNYTAVSDVRFKKNVEPLSGMLKIIDKLHPVSYQLTSNTSQKISYGLIAQEVEKVLPNIVNTIHGDDGDGIQDLRTISYTELIPILINAMQEQQKIISNLQKDLEELKQMR